jgi:hypothetical protein
MRAASTVVNCASFCTMATDWPSHRSAISVTRNSYRETGRLCVSAVRPDQLRAAALDLLVEFQDLPLIALGQGDGRLYLLFVVAWFLYLL